MLCIVIAKAKSGPKSAATPRSSSGDQLPARPDATRAHDGDDTRKWLDSLEFVIEYALRNQGSGQAPYFVDNLIDRLRQAGIKVPPTTNTPYVNTIPVEKEPPYPGDWQIETRIKSFIRWNAMAMVVNANRKHNGLGGHIST